MTNETATSQYLLPSGLRDLLPPDAAHQAFILSTLSQRFALAGYDQVMPPLAEFEQTLLADKGKALETRTFRMMDPLSGQMLAIRPDITMQVGRIAASRLSGAPLPLRLSYAGNVLRTGTDGLTSERQFTQAGIELIGSAAPQADAEVIEVILEALHGLGFDGLVVDMSTAGLLDALLEAETTPYDKEEVLHALRHKDSAAIPASLSCRDTVLHLLESAGSLAALERTLAERSLPPAARSTLEQLAAVTALLTSTHASVTLDPLEASGFGYHQGVCFSLFHSGSQQEIARGGRYSLMIAGMPTSATGATLYVGKLLASYCPTTPAPMRVYVPYGVGMGESLSLRNQGMITVQGLDSQPDTLAEARRMGCSHYFSDGTLHTVK